VQEKSDSSGRLVVEGKDAMQKRCGHAPDLAAGLCCTCVPVFGRMELWK
jgi:hypothetical protein